MTEAAFSGQNRVVVDWDGTCVPQVWPENPQVWEDGAVEAMKAFLSAGYEVYISSTRLAPRQIDEVEKVPQGERYRQYRYIRKMLNEAGLDQVGIWRRPWKPGAKFYIDDKGVRYEGDWQAVREEVLGGKDGRAYREQQLREALAALLDHAERIQEHVPKSENWYAVRDTARMELREP